MIMKNSPSQGKNLSQGENQVITKFTNIDNFVKYCELWKEKKQK